MAELIAFPSTSFSSSPKGCSFPFPGSWVPCEVTFGLWPLHLLCWNHPAWRWLEVVWEAEHAQCDCASAVPHLRKQDRSLREALFDLLVATSKQPQGQAAAGPMVQEKARQCLAQCAAEVMSWGMKATVTYGWVQPQLAARRDVLPPLCSMAISDQRGCLCVFWEEWMQHSSQMPVCSEDFAV